MRAFNTSKPVVSLELDDEDVQKLISVLSYGLQWPDDNVIAKFAEDLYDELCSVAGDKDLLVEEARACRYEL